MGIQAWYMSDATSEDQRDEHQLDPPCPVSLEQLREFGVLYFGVDADMCVWHDDGRM